ncbi:AraC family transcriptional regulator [Maribacter confluentis]|uniref:AraC-type DNA-binding protein n=2 Tax=Maribacter TaxID=252356 RepID=A0ABY1SFW3_9FLAO|nr:MULTISPECIES: AraC family transcriptional regulator [Maribacter]MDO1511564.1 AraC family transcriptional regulator [Maribacter confluentis]SNR40365.1 AraC-type DNA-binding protein [Maribacter sedimenticola]
MKLHLLNRTSELNRSLTINREVKSNFLRVWHYHPEIELVHVVKSSGTRFIGDNIERFTGGDLVLIGKNIPHMWLNDDAYFEEGSGLSAEAISVHFLKNFLGDDFLEVPEMNKISQLLDRAELGIKFIDVEDGIIHKIKELNELRPIDQIIRLLDILALLADHEHYELLSSLGYLDSFRRTENKRLDQIYEFIYENFNSQISACDVADKIGMNKSAFSRYFKKVHRKSFTKYLNEMRIGYACKLMLNDEESITGIAFLSGFNNISNFNRQFKIIKGITPTEFISKYK